MYNKKIKTSASTNYCNKYMGIKRTLVMTDMGLKRTMTAQPQVSNPKQ
jgi:hypothetical protein